MSQPAANFLNNFKSRSQTVKTVVSESIAAMLAVKHHTDVICGFGSCIARHGAKNANTTKII